MPQREPLHKCDIVMKGGITSGIVYPRAVARLAEKYQFQSIGGTSCGAIAAALTAAAEYRRRNGGSVFDRVADVPRWLGEISSEGRHCNLFHLFQPQPAMESLFDLATAFLAPTAGAKLAQAAAVLWPELVGGILPGAVLLALVFRAHPASGIIAGALAILMGLVVGALASVLWRVLKLPSHRFGLCTGYTERRPGFPISLVDWLNRTINDLTGCPADRPLTFGDLSAAGIELKMISTALTLGRPYTLPFTSAEFYFSPAEMRNYFPAEVVQWMVDHPGASGAPGGDIELGELRPLPTADHLPVIFATRLSLSFPVLFCAVPLYRIDFSRRRRAPDEPAPAIRVPGDALAPDEPRRPEPVWFSDGGICANFPLHLFDSPLPQWPTFALDLDELRPDRPQQRVWMPRRNDDGLAPHWLRLGTTAGLGAVLGFVSAIFDAAQNWNENLQAMAPGYRDRIAHMYLSGKEGGLQLDMPQDVIESLAVLGEQAADLLIGHFLEGVDQGQPTAMTWDNHRWIRFRSTMAVTDGFVTAFTGAFDHPEPGDRTYQDLIRDNPSYRMSEAQKTYAASLAEALERVSDEFGEGELANGAPRPLPELRARPRF